MAESENNLTNLTNRYFPDALTVPQEQPACFINEERFRSLVKATGQIVWLTDAHGKMLEAPDLLAFTGQSQAGVAAANWLTYVHPEDQVRVASAWAQSVAFRSRFDAVYRLRKHDGSYGHFEVHGVPLLNTDSSIREWVGTSSNVTAHRQADATVEMLTARLRRAFLEMDHRVKNNLQVISALIELQTTANCEVTLRRVSQYTHALASLHDLLAIAAKKTDAEIGALSMRAILEELTPVLQVHAGERRIACQAEEILSPVRLIGSLVVLVNELISNAIQHGEGDIELTFTVNENRARLEICDAGPGFPPDFEPHQSAKTGLELVQSAVHHDLRGEVSFTTRPGGGARVIVLFPLLKDRSEIGKTY
jgi:PAS domain S-box-containing protein